jgi:apolipoprotein D and lipocalin family protein
MNRAMNPTLRVTLAFLLGVGLSGCLGSSEKFETVNGFDLERYMGTWYEIARLDHRFERGLNQVTATYSLRDDGGVKVINRGFKVDKGDWDEAEGKAYFRGDPDIGELKVSFFGPFYGDYNIVALDEEDYQWSLVAGPSKSYLWILSRTPNLDSEVYSELISIASDAGFAVDDLIEVDH